MDFPHEGILFRECTTLFAGPRGLRMCVDQLLAPYAGLRIDKVVGLEARGFILGGAVAHQLSAGFVPLRKKGKLPHNVITESYELEYGVDSMEISHNDYSVKPQRFLKALEQLHVEILMETTIFPLLYGFMPNLGLYFRPDGSFENPSDLLPLGKIKEAREAQEAAGQACLDDCIEMSDCMVEMGADGIDFDTVASTGDGEFHAVLKACEHVAKDTGLPVEIGMSAEMVLGFHGQLEYNGKRLAGMWPHEQLQVCEEAGCAIFGPVSNTNTRKTTPWNLGKALTFVKACTEIAKIPIHPNVGMGVGGVPMFETPAVDVVTRCSAAMIEIGKADGL